MHAVTPELRPFEQRLGGTSPKAASHPGCDRVDSRNQAVELGRGIRDTDSYSLRTQAPRRSRA